MMDDYRRLMILRLPPWFLLEVLQSLQTPKQVKLKTGTKIPEGVRLISVNADWESQSVELMLEHESFGPVLDGCLIPRISWDTAEFMHTNFERETA